MKMHKFKQNKLWRDKLPEKMRHMGSIIHVRTLTDAEYDEQLRLKLLEEIEEVKASRTNEKLAAELADVLEVIDALCLLHNLTKNDIATIQEKKRAERGGFFDRTFVTIAEHPEGSFGEKYCLEQPEKYPQIE